MKFKRRKCKVCGGKAMQNRAKCYSCWLADQKKLRIARQERQDARRQKKKARVANSLPNLKKKAWKAISAFIRQKGADSQGVNSCYTCGARLPWRELHTGHLFHGRLDYDERNLKPQCARCNIFLNGNGTIYAMKMTEEIGLDGMKALLLEANTKVYTYKELQEIIVKYNEKLSQLNF